jgi:NADH-quinone oxidoreductase subunit N
VSFYQLIELIAPEALVVLTAFLVLALDLALGRRAPPLTRMRLGAAVAGAGCLAAAWWAQHMGATTHGRYADGLLVLDPLIVVVKQALLLLTILTAVLSADAHFTPHRGEYFALLLLAAVGMMLLVSTENLLMIFVALELVSLSLYVLTAFNKQNRWSAESALKYFCLAASPRPSCCSGSATFTACPAS